MEILQYLLSFFVKSLGGKALSPLLELLEKNSYNLGEALKHLTPEIIQPLAEVFMKNINNKKSPTENSVGNSNVSGLNPIANIADKEIVYTLNKYFYSI